MSGPAPALDATAQAALAGLANSGLDGTSIHWFLCGFVRKEAVITWQIEGTQATLRSYVRTHETNRSAGVREVCNYIDAIGHARGQLADPAGAAAGHPPAAQHPPHPAARRTWRGQGAR